MLQHSECTLMVIIGSNTNRNRFKAYVILSQNVDNMFALVLRQEGLVFDSIFNAKCKCIQTGQMETWQINLMTLINNGESSRLPTIQRRPLRLIKYDLADSSTKHNWFVIPKIEFAMLLAAKQWYGSYGRVNF